MEDIIQKIADKLEKANNEIGRIDITHTKDMEIFKNEMNTFRESVEDFKESLNDLGSRVEELDKYMRGITLTCRDRGHVLESSIKEVEDLQKKIDSIFTVLENTNISIKRIIIAVIVALYFFIDGKNINILKEVFSIILRVFGL